MKYNFILHYVFQELSMVGTVLANNLFQQQPQEKEQQRQPNDNNIQNQVNEMNTSQLANTCHKVKVKPTD